MALPLSFKWYRDAGLTQELTGSLPYCQEDDGSSDPVIHEVYLGSIVPAKKLVSDVSPNQAHIYLTVYDADEQAGHPATDIVLALTREELETNTPGGQLDLGTSILGGATNAVHVWISFDDTTREIGGSKDLTIRTTTVKEMYI